MYMLLAFLFLVTCMAVYKTGDIQYKLHKKENYSKEESRHDYILLSLLVSSAIILFINALIFIYYG